MHFTSITAIASLFLASITSAAPAPKRFRLRTQVVREGDKYDGLYVNTYHTEAGGNALFLTKEKGPVAYLNGKELFFDLQKGKDGQYPMQIAYTDPSAAWGTTSANIISGPDKSFAVQDDKLIVTGERAKYFKDLDGARWRVCPWTHSVPELFWNNPETWDNIDPDKVPKFCSLVNLVAEKA